MTGPVVLLGDSIFDNAAYVPPGTSVSERLRDRFPEDWTVTLLAQDGATIADVEAQLLRVPGKVAHLVLSVGGNDALGYASALFNERAASLEAALAKIAQIRDDFARRYRQMLAKVCELEAPLAVCTIYDAVPGLGGAETAGVAVFNDAISRCTFACGAALIDLRLVCNEAEDYAADSPIEPSASGSEKIARAIAAAVLAPQSGSRVIV